MIALALALGLAAAAGPDDTDLPRSLGADDSRFHAAPAPAARDEFALWLGGHLGIAGAYDADGPGFVIGANVRLHLLEWLGADGSLDFQTDQEVDDAAEISQIPFQFAALFYLPLDLPFRPYGQAGVGWTITTVDARGRGDDTDPNLLFFIGFGAEVEVSPDILLDANVRFVFATDPPHSGDFSADWAQFTLGVMIKLSK
jgi:opacity protein-like surface antigen